MKIALITGGSSGIGLAIARMLGRQYEYSLVLFARDAGRLQTAKDQLVEMGLRVEVVAVDLLGRSDLKTLIREASLRFGGDGTIDVLIHSAGTIVEEDASFRDRVGCWRNNVGGTKNILRSCGDLIRHGGFVMVLSSLSALAPLPGISRIYSLSKWGVWKTAEKWHKQRGDVHLAVVFPPVVKTPMTDRLRCSAPIYRAFPWLSTHEVAEVSLRGMFAGVKNVHFSGLYRTLSFVAKFAPRLVGVAIRLYIPLVLWVKRKRTQN